MKNALVVAMVLLPAWSFAAPLACPQGTEGKQICSLNLTKGDFIGKADEITVCVGASGAALVLSREDASHIEIVDRVVPGQKAIQYIIKTDAPNLNWIFTTDTPQPGPGVLALTLVDGAGKTKTASAHYDCVQ